MNIDPRYRARLNQITTTLESANLTTQASIYSIRQSYLSPCLNSISTCLSASCHPCFGERRERARARQRRSAAATARGRPEFVFDFYNDGGGEEEEEGEGEGLLAGWGADELDRLLAGSGAGSGGDLAGAENGRGQPGRIPGMSYGATVTTNGIGAGRMMRKSELLDAAVQGGDSTILPGSSMFGFLERLPWKIGGRGVKYKPSAAGLQENPDRRRRRSRRRGKKGDGKGEINGDPEEASALLEEGEDEDGEGHNYNTRNHSKRSNRRNRSDTTTSRSTANSLSSRGDLLPSGDEAADAVPLDDSFAFILSFAKRSTDGERDSISQSQSTPSATKSPSLTSNHSQTQNPSNRHTNVTQQKMQIQTQTQQTKLPSNPHHPTQASKPAMKSPSILSVLSSNNTNNGNSNNGRIHSRQTSEHEDEYIPDHDEYEYGSENEADESALVSPVVETAEHSELRDDCPPAATAAVKDGYGDGEG